MFRGSAHVVLGSGLTIAGAMFSLSFTRLPYFHTLGVPWRSGCSRPWRVHSRWSGHTHPGQPLRPAHPKRKIKTRGWRRLGTAVVRWPAPILAAACATALVGLLALPSFTTSYNDRNYLPASTPSNVAYAAADRHFSPARLNPDLMRSRPTTTCASGRHASHRPDRESVFQADGVDRVQAITRPLGAPIEHTSIPFQISMQATTLTD